MRITKIIVNVTFCKNKILFKKLTIFALLITVKRTSPQIAKLLIRQCVSHNYLLRTHNFMNICFIIDNKISYYYFFMLLEQSEHILQLLAFLCVGWFCCAKLRMAHMSFVVWSQLARRCEISFNRLGQFFLMTTGVLATS